MTIGTHRHRIDKIRYCFDFSWDRNAQLKKERGIGFEEIIALIESGKLIRILEHPKRQKYSHQFLYEIDVNGYVYIVPFVKTDKGVFLKTIHPSRKATQQFRTKEDGKKN